MLKGVNQWCFPEGTPLATVFEYSRRAGFDAVELNLYEPGGTGLTLDTSAAEAERIARLAAGYGVRLPSIATGLLWKFPLSSADPDVRRKGRDIVRKQLELAGAMGMDTALVVPGKVDETVAYDVCYRRTQDEIGGLLPVAEANRVCIGIENVWNDFLLSPLEMARYIDELGSDFAAAYFDVGNILQYGLPEQWIRLLGRRVRKVHVKDFSVKVGNRYGFVPLLSGHVNWPAVRAALLDIGYADALTAEAMPYPTAPLQAVFDISRHLDVIIGRGER